MVALIQPSELKEWIPWIIAGANAIASILWGVNFQRSSDRLVAARTLRSIVLSRKSRVSNDCHLLF